MAQGKTRFYEYNGFDIKMSELSKQTGISIGKLYYRINDMHMSVEEAIAMGSGEQTGKKYLYEGELLTASEICSRTGITPQTFNARLRDGWSVEDAARNTYTHNVAKRVFTLEQSARTAGMSPEEAARYRAAVKIAYEIAADNVYEFGFRCSIPMTEYLFEGDLLGYRIRFAPDGSTARLSAYYRRTGIDSDLNRLYKVHGPNIKEVRPEWTP